MIEAYCLKDDTNLHADQQIDKDLTKAFEESLAFGRDNKTVRQHVAEVWQSFHQRSQGCAVTAICSICSAAHATIITLQSGRGQVSSHAP